MVETPAQLDYAPQPHWRHRKRTRRLIFAGLVVVILVGSGKWIAPAWRHVCMLYWQEKCLSFEGEGALIMPAPTKPNDVVAWNEFYTLFSPPGRKSGTTIFLHEMRRKDGEPRLVAIEAAEMQAWFSVSDRSGHIIPFDVSVIRPGSLWHRPELMYCAHDSLSVDDRKYGPQAIRFGQLDANNPSHFTVILPQQNGHRTVDGWLGSDDRVTLEMRDQ